MRQVLSAHFSYGKIEAGGSIHPLSSQSAGDGGGIETHKVGGRKEAHHALTLAPSPNFPFKITYHLIGFEKEKL